MYTINCTYFTESFETVEELIAAITAQGMDPNYEIYKNGEPTGEHVIDLIVF